ncbi:MAG: cell division protein FtsZ [Campylobacterales bacterium]|nr:cell division protein FtsZ [Campylobacterales bacterium]
MDNGSLFTIEEHQEEDIVKIKVVGVGGGGGNMVNHMFKEGIRSVDMTVANTDGQALSSSLAPTKIQLGEKSTRGLGAGMKPEVGKRAAEESFEGIKEELSGYDLVFIATGLGGGTGTGASSTIARAAREVGALTVGVCTLPFIFEGPKRTKLAKQGLEELKAECDSIVVIPNDKLIAIVDKNMGYKESFSMVDAVLTRAVSGISSIVLPSGNEGINTDFADLSTVMSHKGLALMGMGQAEGEDSAYEALKTAIQSPLLDDLTINGAMGVLVHFQMNPDYPLVAINQAMNLVFDSADEDADVIFGTSVDSSLENDFIKVTIVATGFEREASNNIDTTVAEETVQTIERNVQHVQRNLKVSGGYEITDGEDYLDVPTFIRRQQD